MDRLTRLLAAEPVRVTAVLRLPLIALICVLVWVWEVDHWLPEVYIVVLGVWAVAAVLWLVLVTRRPVLPRWADWASTGIDVLVVVVLCLVSGGATEALLPVFFLLPIAVAFQDRPLLTALLGVGTAAAYLAVWIVYSKRDDSVGLPNVVYTQFGFLLWSAVAMTALCVVLVRRQARVITLQDVRRQLVSEAMQADERHNREVAEHLHDGPLQTLLAARLDLDEARERVDDPALEAAYTALQQTAAALRSTVTELHPQVLAQLGLTPAVRELVRQFEARGEHVVDADLEEVGKPDSQQLLYRAARELLTNIGKHAGASTVRVTLSRVHDRIVLTVADDGCGFDPAVVDRYVADGHIGLGSLLARFDAMGGSMEVRSTPGQGTTVIATSPPEGELSPREQTQSRIDSA
ncbi:sensor histidine kinase [Mycolicibacterium flavescens]|uniref:ATPase n=1 Tax=Mycolicibacterium flavescens TaxID=1776 RepID=A0A1E3RFA2_MYCFV|nr:sensor histidine kinase [Mycolicibacterium flavescens]MCV7278788.1 sensor histidine kinase [Mycolicibacterium flavescens]ODQ88531.1 ATPase [Mycolicibacterium flavescens]